MVRLPRRGELYKLCSTELHGCRAEETAAEVLQRSFEATTKLDPTKPASALSLVPLVRHYKCSGAVYASRVHWSRSKPNNSFCSWHGSAYDFVVVQGLNQHAALVGCAMAVQMGLCSSFEAALYYFLFCSACRIGNTYLHGLQIRVAYTRNQYGRRLMFHGISFVISSEASLDYTG